MAPSSNFYASSPTVILPPDKPSQHFAHNHYNTSDNRDHTMSGCLANSNSFAANGSLPPVPASLAGRKRSRGDIHAPDDEDDFKATAPSPDTVDEMLTDAATARLVQVASAARPSFPSRKSQRTNGAAAGAENHHAQLMPLQQLRDGVAEPLIDEATRLLGISWTRMDSTEALQISQAAYTKWIQKHYSALKNVAIWFENSAIPGYLVEASNAYSGERAYYIFSNDLTEARLITTDPSQLIPRLQMLPALHLAAPGGCLKAETDPITAAQQEVDSIQVAMSETGGGGDDLAMAMFAGRNEGRAFSPGESVPSDTSHSLCAAHAMELD